MGNYIKHIFLLLTALTAVGCLSDPGFVDPNGATRVDGDMVEMEMSVDVLSDRNNRMSTRAMTPDEESYIETIDVLVFDEDADTFLYSTHGYDIVNTPGSDDKRFKLMLRTASVGGAPNDYIGKNIVLVVLANYRNEWSVIKPGVSSGADAVTVLKLLKFGRPVSGATTEEAKYLLPMAAKTQGCTMTATITGSDFGDIELKRAVTALDVGFNYDLDGNPQGVSNFKLRHIVLDKVFDEGFVTPYASLSVETGQEIPSPVSRSEVTYTVTPTGLGVFRSVYFPQIDLGPDTSSGLSVYLGGFYTPDGEDENTTEETWYKVLISHADNGGNRYLGRNWRYTIRIGSIDGPGALSKEAAGQEVANTWLNANIVPWEIGKAEGSIDGPYVFNVSRTKFFLDNSYRDDDSLQDNILELYTDYSGGWKFDEITYEEPIEEASYWLRVNVNRGEPFETGRLLILTNDNLYSGKDRVGYVHLSAGRWKYRIKVTQASYSIATEETVEISFDAHYSMLNRVVHELSSEYRVTGIDYQGSQSGWLTTVPQMGEYTYSSSIELQSTANTGTETRVAHVKLRSLSGHERILIVRQNWVSCGVGGVPKYKYFSEAQPSVATHIYGQEGIHALLDEYYDYVLTADLFENEEERELALSYLLEMRGKFPDTAYSCFMLENSREGQYNTIGFPGEADDDTYYFAHFQAASACPEGWRLPGDRDADLLFGLIEDTGIDRGVSLWYDDTRNYTGYGSYDTNEHGSDISKIYWSSYGETGYWQLNITEDWHGNDWWGSSYLAVYPESNKDYRITILSTDSGDFMAPVRCVENIPIDRYPTND